MTLFDKFNNQSLECSDWRFCKQSLIANLKHFYYDDSNPRAGGIEKMECSGCSAPVAVTSVIKLAASEHSPVRPEPELSEPSSGAVGGK